MDKLSEMQIPDISNFYILHEGLLATLDDELIEEDYDDIQEQKFSKTSHKRDGLEFQTNFG